MSDEEQTEATIPPAPSATEDKRAGEDEKTVVTIFGSGPAGLTAAHELIERGFYVQVVEPRESRFEESACEVGGLAASQYTRVNDTTRIHHYFYNDLVPDPERELWDVPPAGGYLPFGKGINERDPSGTETMFDCTRGMINYLHSKTLQSSQELYPFAENIVFKENSYEYYPKWEDQLGVTNERKILAICEQLLLAISRYYTDMSYALALKPEYDGWSANILPEVKLREIFLLQIQGHFGTGGDLLNLLAWNRAVAVKQVIVDLLKGRLHNLEKLTKPTAEETEIARKKVAKERYFTGKVLKDVLIWRYDIWRALGFVKDASDHPCLEQPVNFSSIHDEDLPIYSDIGNYLIVTTMPSDERPPRAPSDSDKFNRVQFKAVERIVAGEHGYRYFPSFYKQLFDTMKRTPIVTNLGYDHQGNQAHMYSTTYENLVTPPPTPIARKDGWIELPRRRPKSMEEMQQWVHKTVEAFGGDYRDSLLFSDRLLKFMTSCQERRKKFEDMSWLEFINGTDELDKDSINPAIAAERKTRYSEKAEKLFRTMPQALVAMKAVESDARTYGAASVQNVKDFLSTGELNDRLLNAPTSDAWLRPWKSYLKTQGVNFFVGHLSKLVKVCKTCHKPTEIDSESTCDCGHAETVVIPIAKGARTSRVCKICKQRVTWSRFAEPADRPSGKPCMTHGTNSELKLVTEPYKQDGTPPEKPLKLIESCRECDKEVEWRNEKVIPIDPQTKRPCADHGKEPLDHMLYPMPDAEFSVKSAPLSEFPAAPYIADQLGNVVGSDGTVSTCTNSKVDFFIIALPLEQMADIICSKSDNFTFESDFKTLDTFVRSNWLTEKGEEMKPKPGHKNPTWNAKTIARAEKTGQPMPRFKQPLRDFIGIQYLFDKHVRVGTGHVFYPDANWGITSIAQAYMWNQRPSEEAGYLGQLSVDVGAMYTHHEPTEKQLGSKPTDADRKVAWKATMQLMSEYTWYQIEDTFPTAADESIPSPHYYHLDRAIVFKETFTITWPYSDDTSLPLWRQVMPVVTPVPGAVDYNKTPFLIALPGQFDQRPGRIEPRNPEKPNPRMQDTFSYVTPANSDSFQRIYYNVCHENYVLSGSFMPSHTRLNTMEAANETGRHAVNAILHHMKEVRKKLRKEDECKAISPYRGDSSRKGMNVDIHLMERDELPDLDALKQIDRELMAQGLPHVLDILCTMDAICELPARPTEISKTEQMMAVLRAAMHQKQQKSMAAGGLDGIRLAEQAVKQYTTLSREIGDWLGLVDKR